MPDKKYVYVLADYDEDGLETYCATLDRDKLETLLTKHWPTPVVPPLVEVKDTTIKGFGIPQPDNTTMFFAEKEPAEQYLRQAEEYRIHQQDRQDRIANTNKKALNDALNKLRELLSKSDEELVQENACYDLSHWWGGIQLYVIELE